jgi:hypothetical protein
VIADDATAEAIGFVPWAPPGSPAELREPVWPVSTADRTSAERHVEARLRALPDGSPQLTLRTTAGARVVHLGAEPTEVTVESDARLVRDAVTTVDGTVVALEQFGHDRFEARGTGITPWRHPLPGAGYDSQLLTDAGGRIFVTTRDSLIQVDAAAATVVARLAGGRAVMYPDGRIGFARDRSWVVRDMDTSEETATEIGPAGRTALREAIGADAAGRIYWRGPGTVARMLPDGDLDWLVTLNGIAVSEEHGVTLGTLAGDVARFDNGGRVRVDASADHMGQLAGRGDDGEYLLYREVRAGHGQLSSVDSDGRLLRSGPAPDDIWLTRDSAQSPDFSSVTTDGAVLVAVRAEPGVHIVRLTPVTS